jgi:hypothetical protein
VLGVAAWLRAEEAEGRREDGRLDRAQMVRDRAASHEAAVPGQGAD